MFVLGTTRLNKITAGAVVFEEILSINIYVEIDVFCIHIPRFRNLISLALKARTCASIFRRLCGAQVFLGDSVELKYKIREVVLKFCTTV